ncbi:hypothetical protein SAMN05192552_100477 [Natrinema hispanicum]|uniref:Uncharacterized protein n=2 Tax=Natrinema hispanicum TaxID=392421 RepID=A0A1G6LS83_9EURY|nr:hypothetical protein SAMN05192552_100477 [Natrinema hispanicum]SET20521.1 hypothetical protein SAMN04488694_104225 [Natrinema hispanicum]
MGDPEPNRQKTYLAHARSRHMDEDMLTDQRRLVDLIEDEGWEVTDLELSAYDSPWADEDDPEATVTITARKPYDGESTGDEDDGDDENPFRLK